MPWHRLGPEGPFAPSFPQEFLAECVGRQAETPDLVTFTFRRSDGLPLAFRAGQYVNVAFPVHGSGAEAVDRSYSLSSAATSPWTFSISIKRDPEGLVSRWAHDALHPGAVLEMIGPVGSFHLPDRDRRGRYLLLAAGAGITPLISMLRTLHALPGRTEAVLLYHASAPEDFAFRAELDYLAAVDSRIAVHYSLGDGPAPAAWAGFTGRLSAERIDEIAPDANVRQVFACGPEGYLAALDSVLAECRIDPSDTHTERFTSDTQTEPVDAPAHPEPSYAPPAADGPEPHPTVVSTDGFETFGTGSLAMTFLRSRKQVRLEPGDRMLPAALRAGVRIGMNCQEGMCGSCKVTKVQGEVEMHHQGGIRAREIAAGKFLPCCSTPLTDVVVDA
ncbi:iron-sulfur cluster-binding domain-containing protein [Micrococcales bacterium 31B]|nr:iron-sulfur cluster-binding domain-containing protein [Micrococcales bacterium 31B]